MGLLRKVGGALLVVAAALAGNWVGDTVRATTTGGPEHRIELMHATSDGRTVVGLKVVLTNFVPALLVAFLAGRPRTLYAFLSGAVISALVGDSYEQALSAWVYQAANQSGRMLAVPGGVSTIEDTARF
jgi:hypothetical protein